MEQQLKTRQASAIEVTPEMRDAGLLAFIGWSQKAFPHRDGYRDDLPEIIYRAMEAARRSAA